MIITGLRSQGYCEDEVKECIPKCLEHSKCSINVSNGKREGERKRDRMRERGKEGD